MLPTTHVELSDREIQYTYSDGAPSREEVATLVSLVVREQPQRIFEIGTFRGQTTLNLARHAPPSAKVFTLDIPATHTPVLPDASDAVFNEPEKGGHLRAASDIAEVTQLLGDSALISLAGLARSMDFIFVDGCHSYEYCMLDSLRSLAMIRPGGLIVWHDYSVGWPGVMAALHQLQQSSVPFAGLTRIDNTSLVMLRAE